MGRVACLLEERGAAVIVTWSMLYCGTILIVWAGMSWRYAVAFVAGGVVPMLMVLVVDHFGRDRE